MGLKIFTEICNSAYNVFDAGSTTGKGKRGMIALRIRQGKRSAKEFCEMYSKKFTQAPAYVKMSRQVLRSSIGFRCARPEDFPWSTQKADNWLCVFSCASQDIEADEIEYYIKLSRAASSEASDLYESCAKPCGTRKPNSL